ncbi:MAG: VCBS repeat-containing protein [Anaerolineales bacterium]|nr:VCBS repeat-containing protein [Chloroflexota bacterium]MBL6979616.1 VCBS repeat-containing protein [Anaerolineales bacterium]
MRKYVRLSILITSILLTLISSACVFNAGVRPSSSQDEQSGLIDFGVNEPSDLPLVFEEGWDNGFDRVMWKPWGSPSPALRNEMGYESSTALNPNGDVEYLSGVVSRFNLDLVGGTAIEFWAKGQTSEATHQSLHIGISQTNSKGYTGIDSQAENIAEIYIAAESDFNYVEYRLGVGDREFESFEPLNDSWHHYRIQVNENGTISFFRDGEHKYTSTSQIDFDVYKQQALSIGGSSVSTQMLVDNVAVYGVITTPPQLEFESLSDSFSLGHVVATGLDPARFITLADLDNDGDQDIITTRNSGSRNRILVWENPGELIGFPWDEHIIGKSNAVFIQLSIADFDQDGDLDIASGNTKPADFEVRLWENNGSPFDAIWNATDVGATTHDVGTITSGDFDGDGDIDLVSGAAGEAEVELRLWENPGGSFAGEWSGYDLGVTDDSVFDLEAADFDQDGDLDIATGGRRDEDFEIIVWQNDGAPFDGMWLPNNVGISEGDIQEVIMADFDQDGWPDLAASSDFREDYEIMIWRNNGQPFDSLWQSTDVGETDVHASTFAIADFNLDGFLDVFSGSNNRDDAPELILWRGNAEPFVGLWQKDYVGEIGESPRWLDAGDMDGDGDLDVVIAAQSMVIIWENQAANK